MNQRKFKFPRKSDDLKLFCDEFLLISMEIKHAASLLLVGSVKIIQFEFKSGGGRVTWAAWPSLNAYEMFSS